MKKWFSMVLSLLLILGLVGCGVADEAHVSPSGNGVVSAETASASPDTEDLSLQTDADMFTDRDYNTDYDESESVLIQLNGSSATASSDSVQISGSTITITEEATYILSGSLDDGMILVDAPDTAKLQLVLNGVSIHSETSAPLYILEADKVVITLADGTENALSNGGTFSSIDDSNIDGALFSRQDLTLNGSGSLTVTSPAGHGIVCKDDLVFTGGSFTVSSASHGIDANDSVRITGDTSLTVSAGKDGIHAENNDDASLGFVYVSSGDVQIEAEGDGISAEAYLQIENGSFQILAGGGSENGSRESSESWGGFPGGHGGQLSSEAESDDSSTSMKGIKSTGSMIISDGSFSINAADDAIHSNTSIAISGGAFTITSGDDAFHADETLAVSAGTIEVTESYEGLEALHVSVSGGDISIVASDDGLNAAGGTDSSGSTGGRDGMFGDLGGMSSSDGSIDISGGTLSINASGDGIDANGTVAISGGYIAIAGPTQGDTATLDYDVSATITGGTFIGTGASGMAQTFSDATQGVISVSVGTQSAGTAITLADSSGNTLLSHTPEADYQVVIFSSPELVSGETYTITIGSRSTEVEAS